jgi:hypothetical protein
MVGSDIGGIAVGSRPRIPQEPVVGLQTVDGVGTHHGVDQHENYFGCGLLCNRNAHRKDPVLAS